jgi:tetratricopeptide (TPR) repeat protein
MLRRHFVTLSVLAVVAIVLAPAGFAQAPAVSDFDAQLLAIQSDWANANYSIADSGQKKAAFASLASRAEQFAQAHPTRAEALIWQGIVLSSYAGAKGGLGALGLVNQSRDKLEQALKLEPEALEGSAHTSLGTLYYKVPGFPLGFGDEQKAKQLLESALKINPNGIDPNYLYGDYLFEQGKYADAVAHLNKARAAAPRPNRELADQGRRDEIDQLLAKARRKLS